MNPDKMLKKYKRMYRHGQDDSRVNYAIFAEMKEVNPDQNKLKKLTQRSTRERKRHIVEIDDDSEQDKIDLHNESARKRRKTGPTTSTNTGSKRRHSKRDSAGKRPMESDSETEREKQRSTHNKPRSYYYSYLESLNS